MNISKILIVALILIISLPAVAQTKPDGTAPQFLFPEFSSGKILMKNGARQTVLLNYNTVSEKIVFKKDEVLYDMTNPELMDTIYLQNRKFVPVGKIYHEVLLVAEISFFLQHRSSLLSPGTPAGYGGTSQVASTTIVSSIPTASGMYNLELPSDYIVNPNNVYWIRNGTTYDSFQTERQFLKLFPEKEDELKQFIKKNKIKFDRVPGLITLIAYCNEITGQK